MKTFEFAGVSTLDGVCKVRFANDAARVKILSKAGHRDIDIVQLERPMTKEEAISYLLEINFDDGNMTVRAALEAAADKRGVETPLYKNRDEAKEVVAAETDTDLESVPF